MRVVTVTLLLFTGLTLSACHGGKDEEKRMIALDVTKGFSCVTPLTSAQKDATSDPKIYQETTPGSGMWVPKGWQEVTKPSSTFKGCWVPLPGHPEDTTLVPPKQIPTP
jgi:hypothetical protein